MRPFLVALAVLTRLPLRTAQGAGTAERARAVPWYPAAGLALGLCLAVPAALLQGLPAFLAATLTVALWIGLTGAAPLQGLADTVDGYLGGGGNRSRILTIMRNHQGGVGAVAAVVLVVLAKTLALGCLIRAGAWGAVVAAPLAGRTLMAGILAITPPTPQDPADAPAPPGFDRAAVLLGVLAGLAALGLLLGATGAGMAAILVALALLLRLWFKRTVGGYNGDLLGTACEAGEAAVLALAVWGLGACF
jgi:adenosylcobinamide-GDP ribazoletransferase